MEAKIAALQEGGKAPDEGSQAWNDLRAVHVPPYDHRKFPNKWRKMSRTQPARMLMAHLGNDSYSHIHYSDSQGRTISVREAARLQSFPDGFRFPCSMNPAFRQIGNAVPPLLSYAIALEVRQALGLPGSDDIRVSYGLISETKDSMPASAFAGS